MNIFVPDRGYMKSNGDPQLRSQLNLYLRYLEKSEPSSGKELHYELNKLSFSAVFIFVRMKCTINQKNQIQPFTDLT